MYHDKIVINIFEAFEFHQMPPDPPSINERLSDASGPPSQLYPIPGSTPGWANTHYLQRKHIAEDDHNFYNQNKWPWTVTLHK
jgi:hypothetical protein